LNNNNKDEVARFIGWYWGYYFLKAHYFDYGKSICGGELLLTKASNSRQPINEKIWKKLNANYQLCAYCIYKIKIVARVLNSGNR
jgi:hypothetical protein